MKKQERQFKEIDRVSVMDIDRRSLSKSIEKYIESVNLVKDLCKDVTYCNRNRNIKKKNIQSLITLLQSDNIDDKNSYFHKVNFVGV